MSSFNVAVGRRLIDKRNIKEMNFPPFMPYGLSPGPAREMPGAIMRWGIPPST
jgi:hypothetical protein